MDSSLTNSGGSGWVSKGTFNVSTPGFTLGADAATKPLTPGSTGTFNISITGANNFTGSVSFPATITSSPSGVTGTFSPATSSTATVLTVVVPQGTPANTYSFAITGSSASGSQTNLLNVAVAVSTTAGTPSMTANAGATPQMTTVSSAFASPLAVTVKDASGNAAPNVNVTFAAPTSGASGVFGSATTTTVATNASGVAAVAFTANGTAGGPYSVTATAGGYPTVTFSLTNMAGATSGADFTLTTIRGYDSVAVPASGNAQATFVVRVQSVNSFSNSVTVTPTIDAGGTQAGINCGATTVSVPSGGYVDATLNCTVPSTMAQPVNSFVQSVNGFGNSVTLTPTIDANGAQAGVSCSATTVAVPAGGYADATLKCTLPSTMTQPPRTLLNNGAYYGYPSYNVGVSAVSGSLSHPLTKALVVTPTPTARVHMPTSVPGLTSSIALGVAQTLTLTDAWPISATDAANGYASTPGSIYMTFQDPATVTLDGATVPGSGCTVELASNGAVYLNLDAGGMSAHTYLASWATPLSNAACTPGFQTGVYSVSGTGQSITATFPLTFPVGSTLGNRAVHAYLALSDDSYTWTGLKDLGPVTIH